MKALMIIALMIIGFGSVVLSGWMQDHDPPMGWEKEP
jgi:hypothetical protein